MLFSTVAAPVYIPAKSGGDSLFSTSLPMFIICGLFEDSHPDRWFWFAFFWWLVMLSIFSFAYWHLYVLFGKISIQVFWFPKLSPAGLPSQMFWRLVSLVQNLPAWGVLCGPQTSQSLRRTSTVKTILHLWATHLGGVGFDCSMTLPLLPLSSLLFYSFGIRRVYSGSSGLFHQ